METETPVEDQNEKKVTELAVSSVEEKASPKPTTVEPEVPTITKKEIVNSKGYFSRKHKQKSEEKLAEPAVPKVEKTEIDEKVLKTKVNSAEQKVKSETKVVKTPVPSEEISSTAKKVEPKSLNQNCSSKQKRKMLVQANLNLLLLMLRRHPLRK